MRVRRGAFPQMVTTPALLEMPPTIASRVPAPRIRSSRIRLRMNTWPAGLVNGARLPRTGRERLIPDLMIAPRDAPGFGDEELLGHGVLLAAEVVSPSSRRRDRVAKLRAYAQGRVPLYLLIDQLADPPTVTLFSEPRESSYRSCSPATAGQALRLPEPFGISIDAGKLLG